ncbi:hypothetical protein BFP70_17465 [Thioclava sp. SK-1]|uniref:DUF4123 domain-containing protein n=1 Tax=Thioclava sp. SK-1 TaxID=1889770 RepID=UPI00082493FA|nr:DUF4123 domain-containing protein [Thioclava sp. SK-1]OCX60554.1 hypothetical protein BFP70_17465 [Thioclava sp. SK-1]
MTNDDFWLNIRHAPFNTETPRQSPLEITQTADIIPLGNQFGIWPKKTIPDEARNILFGHIAVKETDTLSDGGEIAVPPMKTYAIIDASKFKLGASEFETFGMPYRCLFKGKYAKYTENVSPYLFEIEYENQLLRRLFTNASGLGQDNDTCLWSKDAAIYLRTRSDFHTTWKHVRKFTRAQDAKGKWYLFRFWEPSVLRDYLYEIRNDPGKVISWFGRRAGDIAFIVLTNGVLHSYTLADDIPTDERAEPIRVDKETHARLHARRFIDAFSEKHNMTFNWKTFDALSYNWENYDENDLKIISLLHGYFKILTKYDPSVSNPSISVDMLEIQKRRYLEKLLFYNNQGVNHVL